MAPVSTNDLIRHHDQGEHEEVLRLARTLEIKPVDDPRSTLIVASSLYKLGRVKDAIQMLSILEPLMRTDASYLTLLGLCLQAIEESNRAEQVYSFALKQHPGHALLSHHAVSFLLTQKRFKEAASVLDQALAQHPDHPQLLAQRQRLLALPEVVEQPPVLPALATPVGNDLHSGSQPEVVNASRQEPTGYSPVVLPDSGESIAASENTLESVRQDKTIQQHRLDPLLLAFSHEEVALEKDNRRRLKASQKKGSGDSQDKQSPGSNTPLKCPDLPAPIMLDVCDELMIAMRAALQDKQYECVLTIANYLRRLDSTRRLDLYRLCAEAYVGLSNFQAAELCLQTLVHSDELDDLDRLNLAGMAMRRHDLDLAEIHLSQLVDPESHAENLESQRQKLDELKLDVLPLLTFTPKGLKSVRVNASKAQQKPVKAISLPAGSKPSSNPASLPAPVPTTVVEKTVSTDIPPPPASKGSRSQARRQSLSKGSQKPPEDKANA